MSKAQLLRYTEWENNNMWYCNDISDVSSIRFEWWVPARMLGISPAEYVQLIITQFHPDRIKYNEERNVLVYCWKNINDCRAFKNWLNAAARKHNFII